MQHNGNNTGARMATQSLRWGAHKRIQQSVSFEPVVHSWLMKKAGRTLSFSEMVNRVLRQQMHLEHQLQGGDDGEETPGFRVLLEQHGQKVSRTIDGAAQEVQVTQAMIAAFAEIAMNEQQFKRWETRVFGKGKKT